MRKFNILFIFLLTIFLVVGVVAIFIQDTDPFSDTTLPEVESMTKVPGYSTMMTVASIVEDELSEDAILDLVVSPSGNEEHVTLKLLSNDLLTEENLLKESYPILLQTSSIEDVTSFTISWHLDNDLPIMSFTLDKSDLSNMMLENYATIPSIAQNYYKHESMN
ncbi:MAG TPA: hypothetical protein VNR38_25810 [Ureibacillus sp.]|nr:hypothetical protein [Ureibacillus sp.]